MLEKIKLRGRWKSKIFDPEIESYIQAAIVELQLAGVKEELIQEENELVLNAITCYVKAYIGTDRTDSSKYLGMFENLKMKLTFVKPKGA